MMNNLQENFGKIFEELKSEIRPIILTNQNISSSESFDSEALYHYTDLNGFIGILQNQSLFASNIGFVNDTQELLYGKNFIIDAFSKLKESLSDLIKPELSERVSTNLDYMGLPEFFITCFSKEKDLLSLWRGYSEMGQGIAIGFYPDLKTSLNVEIKERKIHYKPDVQNEIIKKIGRA